MSKMLVYTSVRLEMLPQLPYIFIARRSHYFISPQSDILLLLHMLCAHLSSHKLGLHPLLAYIFKQGMRKDRR